MFHKKFVNCHEPFVRLIPVQVSLSCHVSCMSQAAYTPFTERELVSFRRLWLLSTVQAHVTPLLPEPEKGSVQEYLERGK